MNSSHKRTRPIRNLMMRISVFKHMKEIIPTMNPIRLITDFGAAIWYGARKIFKTLPLVCVTSIGDKLYGEKFRNWGSGPINEYIKLLFALPFQQPLLDYMNRTWMSGTMWSPADWCIYKRAIRTNNDVEGWHNRLNTRAHHSNISFYILVSLLHTESRLVPIQQQLIYEDKLRKFQKSKLWHFKVNSFNSATNIEKVT